jgi:hypothetical protein
MSSVANGRKREPRIYWPGDVGPVMADIVGRWTILNYPLVCRDEENEYPGCLSAYFNGLLFTAKRDTEGYEVEAIYLKKSKAYDEGTPAWALWAIVVFATQCTCRRFGDDTGMLGRIG